MDFTSKMLSMTSSMTAFQYARRDSIIHELNPIIKIAIWAVLLTIALLTTDPLISVSITIVCVIYYFTAKLKLKEFVRDTRFIFLLTITIFGLYVITERSFAGAVTALIYSLRTVTMFLPVTVLLRTTTTSELLYSLRRLLPYRLIFALTSALRFLPYFSKELDNILNVQRMRGVRITLRTFLSKEGVNCIMVPLTIRAIKTADELSISVSSRAFGACKRRTYLADACGKKQELKTAVQASLPRPSG